MANHIIYGKVGLEQYLTESLKAIGVKLGITIPVRTEGWYALRKTVEDAQRQISAAMGSNVPLDSSSPTAIALSIAAVAPMILGETVTPTPAPTPAPTPTPGDGALYTGTYTIQSAALTTPQADFPTAVRLSQMPQAFWDAVRKDAGHQGGNIRVYADAAKSQRLPVDLWAVDPVAKDGMLYFKPATITTGARFYIECGALTLTQPAASAQYGRNAVWSAYWGVWSFGRSFRNRAGNGEGAGYGITQTFLSNAAPDRVITNYQGIVYNPDLDEWLSVGTNNFQRLKWNATTSAFDVLQTRTAASIAANVDHVGGCEYYNGKYYASAAAGGYANYYLAVFNAADLTTLGLTQIGTGSDTSTGHGGVNLGAAGVCRDPRTGNFYGCHFTDSTFLDEWGFNDTTNQFTWVRKVPITYAGSVPDPATTTATGYQGLTYYKGQVIISDNAGLCLRMFTVDPTAGTAVGGDKVLSFASAQEVEDVCVLGEQLVWLVRDTSATNRLHFYAPRDYAKSGHGGLWLSGATAANSPRFQVDNLPAFTSFTMGGTFAVNNAASSTARGLMSLGTQLPAGSTGQKNFRMMLRANSNYQTYDSFNGSYVGATGAPTAPTNTTGAGAPAAASFQRSHFVYDGANLKRRAVVDNYSSGDVATVAPTDQLTRLLIGPYNLDGDGGGSIHAGFVYIAPQVFSDAYLLAQNAMLADPVAFASVG